MRETPRNAPVELPDNSYTDVILVDFGLSFYPRQQKAPTTRGFESPESLTGSCGKKVDIWAFGVVVYLMVCGHMPFRGTYDILHLRYRASGDHIFDTFVARIFCMHGGRATCTELLNHAWLAVA